MRLKMLLLIAFIALPALSEDKSGTICLGSNLAKSFEEQTDKIYLRINDSEKIFFIRPYNGPRVIANQLDLHLDHQVKVYFEDKVVQSWAVNFSKANSTGLNIWRAPGSWRTDPIDPASCTNSSL